MIDTRTVAAFLTQHRLAVVGASDDPKNFANTVYRSLRDHGYEVVAVHRHAESVAGDRAYTDLADVPGDVDGVVVMVDAEHADDVVRACLARGIRRIWLFKGVGRGAVSPEALARCHENGVEVVEGACPLMFLEPVHGIHRLHRGIRRLNGSLGPRHRR